HNWCLRCGRCRLLRCVGHRVWEVMVCWDPFGIARMSWSRRGLASGLTSPGTAVVAYAFAELDAVCRDLRCPTTAGSRRPAGATSCSVTPGVTGEPVAVTFAW